MAKSCFNCKNMCNKGNRKFGCKLNTEMKGMSFQESIENTCDNYTQKIYKKKDNDEIVFYR